jgi:hypothetical protein
VALVAAVSARTQRKHNHDEESNQDPTEEIESASKALIKATIDRISGTFNKSNNRFVAKFVEDNLKDTLGEATKEGLQNVCSSEGKEQLENLLRRTYNSILVIGNNVFGVEKSLRSDIGQYLFGISASFNDLINITLPEACRNYQGPRRAQ